jgi:hypothetical protein
MKWFKLGNMENIVNQRVCRELQAISHCTNALQDLVWAKIFECQLGKGPVSN